MALPPAEQILWGTGFENVLDFDHPRVLDSPRAWRRPGMVEQASRVRIPGAGYDTWRETGDYMLAGRARWFNRADYVQLQAFLDYAGRGGVFRFVPDKTLPSFYVDNCYLEQPFESPEPELEQADGSQSIDLLIRNSTVDFNNALRGIMFELIPGITSLTDPLVFTFTRADAVTCATRVNKQGQYELVAANVLRLNWKDVDNDGVFETPSYLFEGTRANLIADSDDLSTWTLFGTPVVTPAFATLGSLSLSRVEDDDAVNVEELQRPITFAGDGEKGVLFHVRSPDTPAEGFDNRVSIREAIGGLIRLDVRFSWNADGTLVLSEGAAAAGTVLDIQRLGLAGGRPVYAVSCQSTAVVVANNPRFEVRPCLTGTNVGKMIIGGVQVEEATFPSSLIKTTGTSRTRASDSLSVTLANGAQDMTIFAEYDRPVYADVSAAIAVGTHFFFKIGDNNGNIRVASTLSLSRVMEFAIDTAGSDTFPTVAIPAGSPVRVSAEYKNFNSGPQVRKDVGAGPGTFSSAVSALPAFASQVLIIGCDAVGGGGQLFSSLFRFKIAAGNHTLTTMLTK